MSSAAPNQAIDPTPKDKPSVPEFVKRADIDLSSNGTMLTPEFVAFLNSILLTRGAMSVSEFAKWAGIGRTSAWAEIKNGRLLVPLMQQNAAIVLEPPDAPDRS